MNHVLPNGVEVMSFLDTSDYLDVGFGLKQKRVILGEPGDPTRPIFILTHFPPNAVLPRHYHGDVFVDAVVQGSSNIEGEWHEAGTVRWFPAKAMYGPITAGPEGCILLEYYVDQPGFATVQDQDALTEDMKAEMVRVRAAAQARG
jgi:hypothetical protein